MKSTKNSSKLLIACIALVSVVALLKADYYQSDFFPIGLTGINPTGYPSPNNCPYENVPGENWSWDGDTSEQDLIFNLGINCIGCQDADPKYLVDLNPTNPTQNNYLHKVCIPSFDPNDSIDNIYLITSGFFVDICRVYICGDPDTVPCHVPYKYGYIYEYTTRYNWNHSAYYLFHSYYRPTLAGYGSMLFTNKSDDWDGCDSCYWQDTLIQDTAWGCHGTEVDNWNTFGGDSVWCWLSDRVVSKFGEYFDSNATLTKYFWGFNVISEAPAMYRRTNTYLYSDRWHGCWAAADRYLRGENSTGFNVQSDTIHNWYAPTHQGIRGVTYNDGKDRMLIAKGATWPMHMMDYDIFQYLPEIDAIAVFLHTWCLANLNYGEQKVFDNYLYGSGLTWPSFRYMDKWGYHHTAVYFQQYAGNNLARSDQERRWIAWIALEWNHVKSDGSGALSRRPCPPEIRCAAYLAMSRGCKGILFHGWSFSPDATHEMYPKMQIPYSLPALDTSYIGGGNIGIRDHYGYPFGDDASGDSDCHVLNDGTGTTHWHTDSVDRIDRTYEYLKEFIPEIKVISGVLMQLEWVNAYSLKSTCGKESSCPLDYVDSVTTTDSGYIDLGFFSPYHWQDYGKYLMVVNRDGIAQMDTAVITLYLDFPDGDSLYVVEYGDPDTVYYLGKEEDSCFHLGRYFAPGEGKLFRLESRKA